MIFAVTLLSAALLGGLTWTLLEYAIHRWAGHRWRRNVFGREHTRHHAEGNYFAPAWKKGLSAVAVFALAAPLAVRVAGAGPGGAWALGLVATYLAYEWLHLRAHTHPPRTAYGRWYRRHHFWHHFGDPRINHGVTTALWDRVFGTARPPALIRVPERLCMPWLLGPDGDVWPQFQQDYALRRARRPAPAVTGSGSAATAPARAPDPPPASPAPSAPEAHQTPAPG